jgi:hypothetical protein
LSTLIFSNIYNSIKRATKKIGDIYLSTMPKITASLHYVVGMHIATSSVLNDRKIAFNITLLENSILAIDLETKKF